jgi:hypothetical protein
MDWERNGRMLIGRESLEKDRGSRHQFRVSGISADGLSSFAARRFQEERAPRRYKKGGHQLSVSAKERERGEMWELGWNS